MTGYDIGHGAGGHPLDCYGNTPEYDAILAVKNCLEKGDAPGSILAEIKKSPWDLRAPEYARYLRDALAKAREAHVGDEAKLAALDQAERDLDLPAVQVEDTKSRGKIVGATGIGGPAQ